MTWTVDHPHPDHQPHVGRVPLGRRTYGTGSGGMHYGTTLRCSCGWRPQGNASNQPPSRGGRTQTNALYRQHLIDSIPAADLPDDLYRLFIRSLP